MSQLGVPSITNGTPTTGTQCGDAEMGGATCASACSTCLGEAACAAAVGSVDKDAACSTDSGPALLACMVDPCPSPSPPSPQSQEEPEPEATVITPRGVDPSTWKSHQSMRSTILPPGQQGETGEDGKGVVVGDFNGDGNRDAFVVNAYAYPNEVNFGDGQGGFTSVLLQTGVEYDGRRCTKGDFNSDGIDDVFVANYEFNNEILLSDGQGGFTSTFMPRTDMSQGVATGDFNNDGIDDVYVANRRPTDSPIFNGLADELLICDGQGNFTSALLPAKHGPPTTIGPDGSPLVDHGTMAAELTLSDNVPAPLRGEYFEWSLGGHIDESTGITVGWSWRITVMVDGVEVSGTIDSYDASSKAVNVSWDVNDAPTTAAGTPYSMHYLSPAPDSADVHVGDFNGDGVDDVLIEDGCAGETVVCGRVMINDGQGGLTRAFHIGDCSSDEQHCLQSLNTMDGTQWMEDANGAWVFLDGSEESCHPDSDKAC
eukprot:COSAG05_NODE_439_length_9821_cov_110.691556_1_plen_484_part_10